MPVLRQGLNTYRNRFNKPSKYLNLIAKQVPPTKIRIVGNILKKITRSQKPRLSRIADSDFSRDLNCKFRFCVY